MPVIGLGFILFLVVIAACAPVIAPYDPTQINLDQTFVPPSLGHLLGTDYLGRDTLSRIIYGTQIVLTIGVIAALLMTGVGLLMGLASGYFGGLTDQLLMRVTDIFLILPALPLILICVAVFGPSVINVILIIGILSWPPLARIVRAETLSVMARDFISAERTMGARHTRIIFRHILPNVLSPIFVYAALGIANAILIEAAVDFLGLAPLSVSWGYDLSIALNYWVRGAWWIAFFPGLFILMTCLSFFLISDGLNKMLKVEQ
jgi:peptide/nickel transport system permease protein